MQNESKKILEAEIIKKESKLKLKFREIFEAFFSTFYFILENPLDNLWWEVISLIIQYVQLILFILDEAVSFFY